MGLLNGTCVSTIYGKAQWLTLGNGLEEEVITRGSGFLKEEVAVCNCLNLTDTTYSIHFLFHYKKMDLKQVRINS
jgi:hypothetical protein